jgi:hypothetical protein
MLERNLGNIERVIRLSIGVSLAWWALSQPSLSTTEIFVFLVGFMLVMNGIFSKCYLWYVLDINTASSSDKECA